MQKRLRIMQVINVRWFNATAWYGIFLSRLLQDAGHDVTVLGLPGTESYARAVAMGLKVAPLDLNTVNPVRIPLLMRRMTALLRDFRPHIVNCHRGEGTVLWGLCKAAGHSFGLVRTRGDQRPPKGNVPNRRLHSKLVDALIATNSRTAEQCRAMLGLGNDRVATILGGVDTSRFFPDAEARARVRDICGFGGNDLVIGLLGRFDAVKGHEELMRAVRRVRDTLECPEGGRVRLKLMFVGFPASLSFENMQERLRANGLADCSLITGKVEDVAGHINAMDLGVVASQGSEAIARAAFEIMACGVPLVGTDVGVMPDLLSAKALAPVGDTAALATLIEKSVLDPPYLQNLRNEQYSRISGLAGQDFLNQTLAVYSSALKRIDPTFQLAQRRT